MNCNKDTCKLRCPEGSEHGTCACEKPDECPAPPGKSRRIDRIIELVMELIPKDGAWTALLADLNRVKRNACYRSPEFMAVEWRNLSDVLNEYLPYPPTEEWMMEVANTVSGETFR